MLVTALAQCSSVAMYAPEEMARGEGESREQERLGGSPSYGGLDLSREGRISLPTTPAALSRLMVAYNEAAVGICDAALAAAGGRGRSAADDSSRVPVLYVEAQARGSLAKCLYAQGAVSNSCGRLWRCGGRQCGRRRPATPD